MERNILQFFSFENKNDVFMSSKQNKILLFVFLYLIYFFYNKSKSNNNLGINNDKKVKINAVNNMDKKNEDKEKKGINKYFEIVKYKDKYIEKFNKTEIIINEDELKEIFEKEKKTTLEKLDKMKLEVLQLKNELKLPFEDLYRTDDNKELKEDVLIFADNTLEFLIKTDENWISFNNKYKNLNDCEIYKMLETMEDIFFDNTYNIIQEKYYNDYYSNNNTLKSNDVDDFNEMEEEMEEEMDLTKIYDKIENFDVNYKNGEYDMKTEEEDTNEMNLQMDVKRNEVEIEELEEIILEKTREELKKDIKYLNIKLYFYNLLLLKIMNEIEKWNIGMINDEIKTEIQMIYFNERHSKLINSALMEYIPLHCNVLLVYNNNNKSFEYYSDKIVPYDLLNIAAQRYVTINRCKEVYVDIEQETVKMTDDETIASKKKGLINPTLNIVPKNRANSTLEQAVKLNWSQSSSLKPKEKELKNYKNKINVFVYKGKICDYKILKKIDPIINNKKLKLSFSDYKRLIKK